MRFHALLVLRDEGDLVGQTLDHLLSWADTVAVLDTGSTDDTWDAVQDRARRDRRVVPVGREPVVFNENLRGYLFDRQRSGYEGGDWVLRVDADEVYHVPPPRFVAERVARGESAVHLQWYYFRLTRPEADDYEAGRVDTDADRQRPIGERRRFYKLSTYAEPRMFRYRRSVRWPASASFPFNAGYVARERIPIRHYPHRDPAQMRRRFELRAGQMRHRSDAGGHWKLADWRDELVDATGATAAAAGPVQVGLAGEPGIDVGPLRHWAPGTPLPEVPLYNHVPPWRIRLAQRIVHPLLLPLLDRTRKRWDPAIRPTPLGTPNGHRMDPPEAGV